MLADIQAVVFDLGDTLVAYPLPEWPAVVGQCLDSVYGFLVRSQEDRLPPAAVVPSPEEAHARRGRAGRETARLHRAALAVRRIVRAVSGRTLPQIAEAISRPLMASGTAYPDTLPTLCALRERGYRLGLVSNTPWGTPDYLWEKQVEKFGLTEWIKVRLFSSGIGFRKPDPRIFQAVLDRLAVRPREALFVGDSPSDDIAGAQGVGMRTALIIRGPRPAERTCAAPDLCVHSLAELLSHLP